MMNLNPIKQYADVVNGVIHIHVPEGFHAKPVIVNVVVDKSGFGRNYRPIPERLDCVLRQNR
jgi:hypothetical protein